MSEVLRSRADLELEGLVERRSNAGVTPDDADPLWQSSVARYAEHLREAARAEWSAYHEHMAALHGQLAREHEQKAAQLLQEAGGG